MIERAASMSSVMIVYGTSYGQTARVVARIADRLRAAGCRPTVWRGDLIPTEATVTGYDGFLVAGSVIYGKHQRCLVDFVRQNRGVLNTRPSAFVSICGALIGQWGPGQEEARKYVARFLEQTGWTPRLARSFPGGLPYTRYGLITRWIMKSISRKTGRPTDTSQDWDCTDWNAVDRFAADFESVVGSRVPAVGASV
jgi:menaquinone-dependent protoporphyrinogen oxidase